MQALIPFFPDWLVELAHHVHGACELLPEGMTAQDVRRWNVAALEAAIEKAQPEDRMPWMDDPALRELELGKLLDVLSALDALNVGLSLRGSSRFRGGRMPYHLVPGLD